MVIPASVPHAVALANQLACSIVGRTPNRDRAHEVPNPMTAPALPSSSCGVTSCTPSRDRSTIKAAPATVDAATATARPSLGPVGTGGLGGGAGAGGRVGFGDAGAGATAD